MLLIIIYYVNDATQRNDGWQRNVRRHSVCHCCRKNRLQCGRFSLVTNIVAVTRMRTGCECNCSHQFLETQFISSSLDGWTVARRPAPWRGWTSALITLSSAVLPLSLTAHTFPFSPCCLYIIGMSLLRRRRQPAMYACEQVCIGWHGTGACYTDKLTFSHGSSIKVWGTYYTNVRIIFEFLRYVNVKTSPREETYHEDKEFDRKAAQRATIQQQVAFAWQTAQQRITCLQQHNTVRHLHSTRD